MMKKGILIVIWVFISLGLTNCFGLFDSGSDHIVGRYELLWIDLLETQAIVKESVQETTLTEIVSKYVFAVGHNDEYIIAKQHPTSGFEDGFKINTHITNYFIIHMMEVGKDKVFGPMSYGDFEDARKALGIEVLEFDKIYPESY